MITCFECNKKAVHNHHPIPSSKGGRRTIPLCLNCHSLAHDVSFKAIARNKNRVIRGEQKPLYTQKIKNRVLMMWKAGYRLSFISKKVGFSETTIHQTISSKRK